MHLLVCLGNQLFDPGLWPKTLAKEKPAVYMREDSELCTYYKFHKNKIVFFLSAMREYADELRKKKIKVIYDELGEAKDTYESALDLVIKKNKIKKVWIYEIEDKFFEKRLHNFFIKSRIEFEVLQSPMFLTSREDFKHYLSQYKKPFMKTFYESQRKKHNLLLDETGRPQGGAWSFDIDNRKPLPRDHNPPAILKPTPSQHVKNVSQMCEKVFAIHPGSAAHFWIPTTRKEAKKWLKNFLVQKLAHFGPYEDAIPQHSEFVYHSLLTPFLNSGLLTPDEVIRETIKFSEENQVPLASLEGFVRQIIGWREFVRGIYQSFSEQQDAANFWKHKKKLSKIWYKGGTTLPILERTLRKVFKYGYCHHIERLMILGNLMLLLEIDPKEVHKWFMEMFVDSSDWVMGPNVYGMALHSDGGVFTTKPYICGSNYWRKMSNEKEGDWCAGVDGLYWGFISKHRQFFLKNPRLSMMVRSYDKMSLARKKQLAVAADKLKAELTLG